MPDSVLFKVQAVKVRIEACDLPGPTRFKAICSRCGQIIRDRREIYRDGRLLCLPCTDACDFSLAREITWPEMNWSPQPR